MRFRVHSTMLLFAALMCACTNHPTGGPVGIVPASQHYATTAYSASRTTASMSGFANLYVANQTNNITVYDRTSRQPLRTLTETSCFTPLQMVFAADGTLYTGSYCDGAVYGFAIGAVHPTYTARGFVHPFPVAVDKS